MILHVPRDEMVTKTHTNMPKYFNVKHLGPCVQAYRHIDSKILLQASGQRLEYGVFC